MWVVRSTSMPTLLLTLLKVLRALCKGTSNPPYNYPIPYTLNHEPPSSSNNESTILRHSPLVSLQAGARRVSRGSWSKEFRVQGLRS